MKTIPHLSGEAMRTVDLTVTDRIGVCRVMEVVSARTVEFIVYHLKVDRTVPFCFVAGRGNNGGDAVAAARMLKGWGYDVSLVLASDASELKGETKDQFALYESFGGRVIDTLLDRECVIVDGLLGTGIENDPQGQTAELIDAINASGQSVLSLDLPSGLHATTGEPFDPCVRSTWTLTYHIPKSGLLEEAARSYVGELWCSETDLTFTEFPELEEELQEFYKDGLIVRVT